MPGLKRLAGVIVSVGLFASGAFAVEGDIVFQRDSDVKTPPPAVFPHWIHRIRYACQACHPEPFQMRKGASGVSMQAIVEGKWCGVCHNEKIAWGVSFDTCGRCHREQ